MNIKRFEKAERFEPVMLLALRNNSDGSVQVIAVDSFGERLPHGDLFRFNRDGTVTPAGTISETLGFKLDDHGRIMVKL